MIDLIKEKIANYVVRRNLKKKNNSIQQSFLKPIHNSINFLIIMPLDERDFNDSTLVLDFLESQNKNLSIFTYDFRVALLPVKFRNRTISFNLMEINKLKLPSRDLTNRLRNLDYDVVIDLNRSESLLCSYVSNLINSKIRIGLSKKNDHNFYNMIFSINQNVNTNFYSDLINAIKMF
jgi:hypothetical protein